jgi:peptidoglycan-associated lipoprotein
MRISIYSLLFLAVVATTASAQTQQSAPWSSHVSLAVTYSADRTNLTTGSSFWMQGGCAELSGNLPHGFGVVADVTGLHAGSISSTAVPLSLVAFTFGPRFTWRSPWRPERHDMSLFGQALLGEAHGFDSIFPSSSGVSSSASSLALQAGGGMDLGLKRHVSLRLLQVDWLRTQLPNGGTNVQNHFRISTGVELHF